MRSFSPGAVATTALWKSAPMAASGLLLWARRPGDIDRLHHGRRAAATTRSVTLSAERGSQGFKNSEISKHVHV